MTNNNSYDWFILYDREECFECISQHHSSDMKPESPIGLRCIATQMAKHGSINIKVMKVINLENKVIVEPCEN